MASEISETKAKNPRVTVPKVLWYRYTQHEKRLMQENEARSVKFGGLPLGLFSAIATTLLFKKGYVHANPKAFMGPVSKIIMFTIVGFVIGTYAYEEVSAETVLENLPHSPYVEYVRQQRDSNRLGIVNRLANFIGFNEDTSTSSTTTGA